MASEKERENKWTNRATSSRTTSIHPFFLHRHHRHHEQNVPSSRINRSVSSSSCTLPRPLGVCDSIHDRRLSVLFLLVVSSIVHDDVDDSLGYVLSSGFLDPGWVCLVVVAVAVVLTIFPQKRKELWRQAPEQLTVDYDYDYDVYCNNNFSDCNCDCDCDKRWHQYNRTTPAKIQ